MTIADDIASAISGHPRVPSRDNGGPITVIGHPGLFTPAEVKRLSRELPLILVSTPGTLDPAAANRQFGSLLFTPFSVNIDLLASGPHKTQGSELSRQDKVQAMLLGVLKLLGLWTTVPTNSAEVAPVYHLASLGKPTGVTSRNIYSTIIDKQGLAWWRISYTADFQHDDPAGGDYNVWDLLHAEHPKDDWRDGVVVDPSDPILTTETDMSP